MKKLLFLLLIAVAFMLSVAGCRDKKPAPVALSDSVASDTSATTDTADAIISETPMPKAADELFDDFFFNFAANRKLQHKRIHYPLPVYRNGKVVKYIQKGHWKTEHFFMYQDFYTLIFDNRKQMNIVKDTTIDHVVVEKIFFKIRTVQQYLFNRINGQWIMTSVNYKPMYQNQNASFLKFYKQFAVDTAFQRRHLAANIKFSGPDPDDDFKTMTANLAPEQWPAFAPPMPSGMIYNIIYGQKYVESSQKIFVIRGIANGQEQEFTFVRRHGNWVLTRLSI